MKLLSLWHFQEMYEEYKKSMKQGILDYVLLDLKEQRRLGLHMPEPVRR